MWLFVPAINRLAGKRRRFSLVHERRLVAKPQLDRARHDVVGGLLGQDGDLHAVGQPERTTRLSMLAIVGSNDSPRTTVTVLL